MDFVGFLSMVIQVTYVVLYTQCLRYNICSVWFLDIRISTCSSSYRRINIVVVQLLDIYIYIYIYMYG